MSKKTSKERELRISVRADADLAQRIDKAAKDAGISTADIVRMAIRKYLPDQEKKAA